MNAPHASRLPDSPVSPEGVVLSLELRPVIRLSDDEFFLIDPREGQVHVYGPESPVELLQRPRSVSGDPLLPGFRLEMAEIW